MDETRVPVLAVGDVHGRFDLLQLVIDKWDDIYQKSNSQRVSFIALGDVIDRGPQSLEVLDLLAQLASHPQTKDLVHLIKGNHEQMLLNFLHDPGRHGPMWLRNGGVNTLRSYGLKISESESDWGNLTRLRDEFTYRLPESHQALLENAPSLVIGNKVAFCHASIDPSLPLTEQRDKDLLWSRTFPDDSINYDGPLIIHGHEPHREPLSARHHMNVDTGAYATGTLTYVLTNGEEHHINHVRLAPKHL